ncbi:hypothetical protein GCM10008018_14060 [Paenibacillus marchantiophytorum]|uniref:Transposase DDE domain-containing protein n=1 Tax=Paenibacillus marchantiophytorum TaxID=1619310 RepID=A0ABQ2BRF8_9BACL|nr:hypothetical protein [Paenibacillus marchantiophytorum]GGI45825.1 hypothetical protein GCM10008018_14060 [Paenibacillus marchantiophytorum]
MEKHPIQNEKSQVSLGNLVTCLAHNNKKEGYHHFFKTTDCATCPIQMQCTTDKEGQPVRRERSKNKQSS